MRATIWLDQNLTGQRDPNDTLLPGVKVIVAGQTLTTSAYGRAEVRLGDGTSCMGPDRSGRQVVSMTISAEAPPGYQPTTPLSVKITNLPGIVNFGFTYLPGVPTITPRPARP